MHACHVIIKQKEMIWIPKIPHKPFPGPGRYICQSCFKKAIIQYLHGSQWYWQHPPASPIFEIPPAINYSTSMSWSLPFLGLSRVITWSIELGPWCASTIIAISISKCAFLSAQWIHIAQGTKCIFFYPIHRIFAAYAICKFSLDFLTPIWGCKRHRTGNKTNLSLSPRGKILFF